MVKTKFRFTHVLAFLCLSIAAHAQAVPKPLAERLGYGRDAKLLIVHADDLGMTHSVNLATVRALESGLVTSASVMVPCPWFPEVADYARTHPNVDLGLHLTLTSERAFYRWGPVAPTDKVPGLLDKDGYFHQEWTDGTRIDPKEAELEIRAQIDKALRMGVRPTHIDSHQYRLFGTGKELFEMLLRVGHNYGLPVFVSKDWFSKWPYLQSSMAPEDIVIDHSVSIEPDVSAESWKAFYVNAINNLQPGVTEFVIHLAFDDEEMRAATRDRVTWDAAWRQRDYDFFTSDEFRKLLTENNIRLITWREIDKVVQK